MIEDNADNIKRIVNIQENQENYFVSQDKKYVIKTLSRKEHQTLLQRILKQYHKRIMEGSYLQRIYGVYKLTYNGEYVRVMILKNPCIDSNSNLQPKTLSKSIKLIDCSDTGLNKDPHLEIPQEERLEFLKIIDKDLSFLKTLKLMSFTILLFTQRGSSDSHSTFHSEYNESILCLSVLIRLSLSESAFKKKSQGLVSQEDSVEDIKAAITKLLNL